jgi:hypothetical protein
VWAIKRCPRPASPCSGCQADAGGRPDTLRVAPGSLRERLTLRRGRNGRPLGGGLDQRRVGNRMALAVQVIWNGRRFRRRQPGRIRRRRQQVPPDRPCGLQVQPGIDQVRRHSQGL